MTNHQLQIIRKPGPTSTTDVLPPVQRYAPACRTDSSRPSSPAEAETPASSGSPVTHHESRREPSDHQLSTLNHQPIRRTRNGKIARLPHPVRDMVNRMLRNNIPHSKIAEALTE